MKIDKTNRDNRIEVLGDSILSIVNSMAEGKDHRLSLLTKHGISPVSGKWYPQSALMEALKDLLLTTGEMNLFQIGKAVMSHAKFPPIKDLEEGLRLLDTAYHMNHRIDGKIMFDPNTGAKLKGIGNYSLERYDAKTRSAAMVCTNPYPSKFDEGLITQIVRNFRPANSTKMSVTLDLSAGSRIKGDPSCTFLIQW